MCIGEDPKVGHDLEGVGAEVLDLHPVQVHLLRGVVVHLEPLAAGVVDHGRVPHDFGDDQRVGWQHPLVDQAVAVVIQTVVEFRRAGVDSRIAVIEVSLAGHEPVSVVVDLVSREDAITVVVQAVANLRGAGVHRGVIVVGITIAGGEAVAIEVIEVQRGIGIIALLAGEIAISVVIHFIVRHRPIAVIVEGVAELRGPWIDGCIPVVAVAVADHEAVSVVICFIGRFDAITVVVNGITQFLGAGVCVRVRVVAVPRTGVPAVPVHVVAERCWGRDQVGLPRAVRAFIVVGCSDDEVSVPVAVHVPYAGDSRSCHVVRAFRIVEGIHTRERCAHAPSRLTARDDVDDTVLLRVFSVWRTDQDVVESVTVNITAPSRGVAGSGSALSYERRVRFCKAGIHAPATRPSQDQICLTGVAAGADPDQDVVIPVSVDVATARNAVPATNLVRRGLAMERRVGATEIHVHGPPRRRTEE